MSSASAGLELVPLGGIGAEVRPPAPGVDALIRGAARLLEGIARFGVVVVRGRPLEPGEQVALSASLGAPHDHRAHRHHPDHTEILVVDSSRRKPGSENVWHNDLSYRERPPDVSVLHAVRVPDVGGDTIFADGRRSLDRLPHRTRELVAGLTAVHRDGDAPERTAVHALVKTSLSAEPTLFVNELYLTLVNDIAPGEGRSLCRSLLEHMRQPEFTLRHRWRAGDTVLWDNIAMAHYGFQDFDPAFGRVLHRTCVYVRPGGR